METLPTATFVNPGRSMRVKFTTAEKAMKSHYETVIEVSHISEGTICFIFSICFNYTKFSLTFKPHVL